MGNKTVFVKRRVTANVRTVLMFVLALGLLVSSYSSQVNAATANTLKVTPVRTDIEVKPGEKKTVVATVTNLTGAPITVKPIQNDFIAGDERGTPALILDEKQSAPTHSLKKFMAPLANATIPAGKTAMFNIVLSVPKDTQAGGYFGAVRFAPTTPDGGGQVNLSASVASIILLTVPGDAVEKLSVSDFAVQQKGKTGTRFSTPDDLTATVRFQNEGNLQMGPVGKVSITKGDELVSESDFNTGNPKDMVLPDSARRWDIPLKDVGTFGQYTVTATFTYGKENRTIEVKKSFWVIPTFVIFLAIGGLVLLVLLIAGIWFFLRSYKRRILRNSSNGRRSRHRR